MDVRQLINCLAHLKQSRLDLIARDLGITQNLSPYFVEMSTTIEKNQLNNMLLRLGIGRTGLLPGVHHFYIRRHSDWRLLESISAIFTSGVMTRWVPAEGQISDHIYVVRGKHWHAVLHIETFWKRIPKTLFKYLHWSVDRSYRLQRELVVPTYILGYARNGNLTENDLSSVIEGYGYTHDWKRVANTCHRNDVTPRELLAWLDRWAPIMRELDRRAVDPAELAKWLASRAEVAPTPGSNVIPLARAS